jgi:hypothetical protein
MEALPMSVSCLLKNYLNLRARTGIGLHRTANLPGRRVAEVTVALMPYLQAAAETATGYCCHCCNLYTKIHFNLYDFEHF